MDLAPKTPDTGDGMMAKTTTADTDFTKIPDFTQAQADFSKWMTDFSKFFTTGKTPGFDFDGIFAAQRKNVEAITAANQAAFEGVKAVAQRQAEIVRATIEDFTKAAKELSTVATPEEKLVKQTELAKSGFEAAIANLRDVSETLQKANVEAAALINKRVVASLEELKDVFAKAKK
jgi:phasin family protein